MRLRYLPEALADLRGIHDYIAQDNPRAARNVLQAVRGQTLCLTEHPDLGRPGRVEGTQELVIGKYPYIVTYRVEGGEIQVLAIVHTSRRWPKGFGGAEP